MSFPDPVPQLDIEFELLGQVAVCTLLVSIRMVWCGRTVPAVKRPHERKYISNGHRIPSLVITALRTTNIRVYESLVRFWLEKRLESPFRFRKLAGAFVSSVAPLSSVCRGVENISQKCAELLRLVWFFVGPLVDAAVFGWRACANSQCLFIIFWDSAFVAICAF